MEQNFNPGLAIIGLSGNGPWTSQFCFVFFFYSNWFSEYKHPFIDKPMFVTKPDVHVQRRTAIQVSQQEGCTCSINILLNLCSVFLDYAKIELVKLEETLCHQGPFATAAMEAALFAGNSTKNKYLHDSFLKHSEATCKRAQQLPTMLGVVSQQCCVHLHGAKSLTGFKLYATTRNNIQQHATGCANEHNM